jgi:hypothetical protein
MKRRRLPTKLRKIIYHLLTSELTAMMTVRGITELAERHRFYAATQRGESRNEALLG